MVSQRWVVFEEYAKHGLVARAGFGRAVVFAGTQEPIVGNDRPVHYFVGDYRDSHERHDGEFATYQEARAAADEANRFEAQGPLDPAFLERRDRLKKLAPDFHFLYEGPPEARWPVRPGKYALLCMEHGWHASDHWELADTLEDVKASILEDDQTVLRVVDLDTGDDVPFQRSVTVEIGPA